MSSWSDRKHSPCRWLGCFEGMQGLFLDFEIKGVNVDPISQAESICRDLSMV